MKVRRAKCKSGRVLGVLVCERERDRGGVDLNGLVGFFPLCLWA